MASTVDRSGVQINRVLRRLQKLSPKSFSSRVRLVIDAETILMASKIREKMMSGPTSNRSLSPRTGRLRRTTRHKPAKVVRGTTMVKGGIRFGTKYAKTHIGKRGRTVTIKPKTSNWLTIPISKEYGGQALTAAGRSRGSAGSGVFKDTYVRKSKKGNLILFGKFGASKKTAPLFVLKKSVRIKQRVDTKQILRWARKAILKKLKKEVLDAGRR